MLTKHGTIDIYEQEQWPSVIHGVLLYSENEYGCASHIAMKSLLGDIKPAGRVLTHLINQMVFNQTKEYEDIGWEYYFYNGVMIVNINRWPQTPIMPLQEAQATWIHCYPPVRDFVSYMKNKYDNLGYFTYVTSTTLHDALNNDIFAVHSPDEMLCYSHSTSQKLRINGPSKLKTDLFFSPPAWLFPHLAHKMGISNCLSIFSGHDPEAGDVDEVAALTLFRWLNQLTGKGRTKHALNSTLKKTKKEVSDSLLLRKELEELLEGAQGNAEAPNMLWG